MSQIPIITRKYEDFKPLRFKIKLAKYGKTAADILTGTGDIIFSVKSVETAIDTELLLKKLSVPSEIVIVSGSGTDTTVVVDVEWLNTDYSNFTVGDKVLAGLFVKFDGDPLADENVDTTFKVEIVQDFLRA
jgi:hypothetical protein